MTVNYKAIADELTKRIASGELSVGEQMPPQRIFAYKRGIAVSTASRVYDLLKRRGLISGETGRGTYVCNRLESLSSHLIEPTTAQVDLELVFPVNEDQTQQITRSLIAMARSKQITDVLKPVGTAGTKEARVVAADFLSRCEWTPSPEQILFAGNGKQAIAAAIAGLASPGDWIGVEALTYPFVKIIAAQLGVRLEPLAMDKFGLLPSEIINAKRKKSIKAVYMQPSLQSPLAITMNGARRSEIAATLKQAGVIAIEDGIYSFLVEETPVAAFAPENVVYIDSLSKNVSPALTLATLVVPPKLLKQMAKAIRAGAWTATGLSIAMGCLWMKDGTAKSIGQSKRADAAARQKIARKVLADLEITGDERAYHLWLTLPEPWDTKTFSKSAAELGIAVMPSSAFAVSSKDASPAVRLALTTRDLTILKHSLSALRSLAMRR